MRNLIILVLCLFSVLANAQRFKLEESEISFFSEAPLENIEAVNNSSTGIFDSSTGELVLSIPISKFDFEKSLMKEHFNEKYLESEKYPRAVFKGKFSNYSIDKIGQKLTIRGSLTIHGVEKEYSLSGSSMKSGDQIEFTTEFPIAVKDHKIKIPKLMWQNIAEEVSVKAKLIFKPYD